MTFRLPRSYLVDRRGASAVEFALIVPVLLLMVFGGLGLGLGFWAKNALQDASDETARCLAIGSPLCQSATCGSSSAGVCYAIKTAATRGIANVAVGEVAVSSLVTYAGVSFTSVTIAHSYKMAGYSFVLSAQGSFPNK